MVQNSKIGPISPSWTSTGSWTLHLHALPLMAVVVAGLLLTWNVPCAVGNFFHVLKQTDPSFRSAVIFATTTPEEEDVVYVPYPQDDKSCVCGQVMMLIAWPDDQDARIAPRWPLTWDAQNESCRIAEGGPCVATDIPDLEIGCHQHLGVNLECIEYRCRDPQKLGQAPENHKCHATIDCIEGLKCDYPPGTRTRWGDRPFQNGRSEYTDKYCLGPQRDLEYEAGWEKMREYLKRESQEKFEKEVKLAMENFFSGLMEATIFILKYAALAASLTLLFAVCDRICRVEFWTHFSSAM